jgi:glycosyltransferase involved in cell wall biosynthesis
METLSADVWAVLEAHFPEAVLVAHGGRKRSLPWFFVGAWWRVLRDVRAHECDVVVTGDAVMFVALWPLLVMLRVPTATLVMGLDLTWPPRLYQRLIRVVVPRAERVLAISNATADAARAIGVPDARLSVIRLGAAPPSGGPPDRRAARAALHAELGLDADAMIVATLGRLVRRKGVRWFVTDVLPKLPASVHYVIAGSGPERREVEAAILASGVGDRVHLLGRVDDEQRELVLSGADVFAQPNLAVPGDMEGFGLVVVEAAHRGTPVVASELEGIRDAVVGGETGVLCPAGDATAWLEVLRPMLEDRGRLDALGARFQRCASGLYGPHALAETLGVELGLVTSPA